MLNTALIYILPALMLVAGLSDLLTYRIPNWIALATAGAFLVIAPAAGLPLAAIGLHGLVAVGVLAVTFGFFAAGWMGGGDAKLAAATALWFGPAAVAPFLLAAAIAGGVLTLALVLLRPMGILPASAMKITWLWRLFDTKSGIPYGIALAAAGLLVYPQSPIYLALAG